LQIQRVHQGTISESHPVAVAGPLLGGSDRFDVLNRCNPVDAPGSPNVARVEVADLRGATLGAWLLQVRFEEFECAFRCVFGLDLDERTENVR